ncbi:two-component system sensor histidine kinase NtrB [Pseudoxanthomonas sp. GW2]|jgi:Signal transduction histidine kinase, nitrogen specific|uniref:Sensory histidine kinase/phosphatase NtrB n=2 Tax=Pseudoxanthomonas TaxID=83618 RepID=A0A562DK10_9GAMM|nr:two-component system nitrogen regulation sensor histidine kinase GlnL [Pseudoxanthomonas taiwanensis J19]
MSAVAAPTLEHLATPVVWADAQARIAGVNAAFPRWLGIGPRRLVGQPLAALEQEGDALARFLEQDEREILRLHRIALGLPGEAPRLADGWVTRVEGGWLLEAHPCDDLTLPDAAQALPGALQAALKGLAHELRNPLAGLKGAAQLLSRRAASRQDDAGERELIELIGSEIERLSSLVDQLLSPAPQRPHAPLNIHAVLERVLRLAEAEAEGRRPVRMQRDYDPSIPEFPGDADRLAQAVWNLVNNALQAGASTIILRTRFEHGLNIRDHLHARALRVEIVDDGRGVPEELAEHLFLPLVSGRAEGTGLGLALAHQVAREHRGTLTFRSRPGHTVFTLLLPQTEPEGETAA